MRSFHTQHSNYLTDRSKGTDTHNETGSFRTFHEPVMRKNFVRTNVNKPRFISKKAC